MNEETSKLPDIGQAEEVPQFLSQDKWFGIDVHPYRLDFAKRYEAPKYTLSWNGIGFAPLGGIHAITGQAGTGKTMTIAQFIASILCGEFGNLRYELEDDIPEPKVLYIDTEMEEANTIAMKNRVLTMCNRQLEQNYDDFVVLMLREVTGEDRTSAAVMRWRMVLKAIYEYKPTVCFVDGLLDVVENFNDNTMCQELIYKCMQAATHYGISIWCLVHQNPGGEKLVGHLGSMLERKVTDIFQTSKEKNATTGLATFTITQKKARGRDIPDWKFQVLPVTGWGIPEQLNVAPTENDTPENIKQWLTIGRDDIEWPATKEKIRSIFRNRGGVKSNPAQLDNLKVAINLRYIIPQPDDTLIKGQTHKKFILNPVIFPIKEDLPFEPPKDEQTVLDF